MDKTILFIVILTTYLTENNLSYLIIETKIPIHCKNIAYYEFLNSGPLSQGYTISEDQWCGASCELSTLPSLYDTMVVDFNWCGKTLMNDTETEPHDIFKSVSSCQAEPSDLSSGIHLITLQLAPRSWLWCKTPRQHINTKLLQTSHRLFQKFGSQNRLHDACVSCCRIRVFSLTLRWWRSITVYIPLLYRESCDAAWSQDA